MNNNVNRKLNDIQEICMDIQKEIRDDKKSDSDLELIQIKSRLTDAYTYVCTCLANSKIVIDGYRESGLTLNQLEAEGYLRGLLLTKEIFEDKILKDYNHLDFLEGVEL